MKAIKKIMSMLLVLTMTMCLAVTAFAAVETNGVITVSGSQLNGKEVTIIRMFTGNIGAGDASVGYTMESAWQDFFNKQLNKGVGEDAAAQEAYEYVAAMNDHEAQLVEFAKKAKDEYKKNPGAFAALVETKTAGATNSVTFNNLTSGYYLVLPASGSASVDRVTDAMLVNVRDDHPANIDLKTEYPTVDKTVTPDGGHGTSAQIGDKLTFTLTSKVPNMTDYKTYFFKFKDTMSKGLTLDQNSVKVTIGGQTVAAEHYNVSATTNPQGETVLEVTFNDLKTVPNATAGAVIKVEYDATLNKDAQIGKNDPNTNKAELEYSNDPDSESHGNSEPSITKTYTFDVQVHKYANDAMDTLLPGAVFQLQSEDGTPIKLVKENETTYRVATKEDLDTVESFQTVVAGNIQIKGLKAGKYQLEEIAAPEGYNPLAKPVKFEIQANYEADGSLSAGYPKYVIDSATATESNIINIQNKSGAFLPETGSIGTIGLTLAGVALVVGGIGFTSRKKKEQE